MSPNTDGASLSKLANTLHEMLAGAAVIAVAVLSIACWKRGVAPPNPEAALLLAAILVLGCTLGRAALRRMERVGGSDDVLNALSAAYRVDPNAPAPEPPQRPARRRLPEMVPVLVVLAAVAAVVLIFEIETPAANAPPRPVTQASATATAATSAEKAPAETGSDWSIWPAIAAITLSELMFLGWIVEGGAIADELVLISRWRTRQPVPSPRHSPDAAARRARHLYELLVRYGVVLTLPET